MTPDSGSFLWDTGTIVWFQQVLGPAWEIPFQLVTLLGDSGFVLILIGAVFWVFGRRVAYATLAAVIAGAVIGTVAKIGTDVARPEHPDLLLYYGSSAPSFPSGHTLLAIAFWGTLVTLGKVRASIATVIVTLVILSRLYLGAHFVADLVAGIVLGFLALAVGYGIRRLLLDRLSDHWLTMLITIGFFGGILVLPVADTFPLGWEILGGLLGAGVATLVEWRYVRYEPRPVGISWQTLKLAIGFAGVLVFIAIGSTLRETEPLVRSGVFFLAGLWMMLAAPLLLDRIGFSESEPAPSQTRQVMQS
jgi:membrane-associated phospholipid phosphatase